MSNGKKEGSSLCPQCGEKCVLEAVSGGLKRRTCPIHGRIPGFISWNEENTDSAPTNAVDVGGWHNPSLSD